MSAEKRCLVIGANGFIGSHLVDELAEAGFSLKAFDLFNSLPQFEKSREIEVFKGDLFDPVALDKALKDVDYVFHCYSATTPYSSDDDPYTDIDRNLKRSVQIFEQCVKSKVKKVIFISSGGAIYGHVAEDRPATEEDAATPVSPYGICKLAVENYLAYFNRKHDLGYITYRLTNPYGPRQQLRNNQGVVPAFLQKIEQNKPLEVFGDGSNSRDYIYIRDATKMIAASFAKDTKYHTYNIGSGRQTTLNEIIETLKAITGQPIKVHYQNALKTFLKSSQISIDRFVDEFNILPSTGLEFGLKLTLKDRNSRPFTDYRN